MFKETRDKLDMQQGKFYKTTFTLETACVLNMWIFEYTTAFVPDKTFANINAKEHKSNLICLLYWLCDVYVAILLNIS